MKLRAYSAQRWLVWCLLVFPFMGIAQPKQEIPSDDFKLKGFHIDLRIQVMTPEALRNFVDELADEGMNTLVMEWEGTYPYKDHAVISNKYAYSREEVKDFIAYCEEKGIQVIPLQQTLGHAEYILRHSRYADLKVNRHDISQINPLKIEESKSLFNDLLSDMASMHNSDYIHIGGDETRILTQCDGCKEKIAEEGISKLYVDYIKTIAQLVIDMGKTPVMWADMILQHPEAADELPKELILIDWNYGWKIDHFGDIPALQKLGFTFWGSPGIRAHPDNWYITTWPTHFINQQEFIPYARKAGYEAMIMTSWSTSGLYGFIWEDGYEVVDMEQIRNVYPMSGFQILNASFYEALRSQKAIDPKEFITRYAKDHYDLNKKEAGALVDYLFFKQEMIVNDKPIYKRNIADLRKAFLAVAQPILQLTPSRHAKEFEHFKLMADLRIFYLDFKQIKANYNADTFVQDDAEKMIGELDTLIESAKALDKRFVELNKGYLYEAELKEQNLIRVRPLKVLRDRLARTK